MTFYQWAMTRKITNTPRGDFLKDMREDKHASTVANTKEAWEDNLLRWGACAGARVAFRSLWVSYCNQCGDPEQQTGATAPLRTGLLFEMAVQT